MYRCTKPIRSVICACTLGNTEHGKTRLVFRTFHYNGYGTTTVMWPNHTWAKLLDSDQKGYKWEIPNILKTCHGERGTQSLELIFKNTNICHLPQCQQNEAISNNQYCIDFSAITKFVHSSESES